jgi:hypothetical protein
LWTKTVKAFVTVNHSLNKGQFMKNSIFRCILAGATMAALAVSVVWPPQSAKAQAQPAPPTAASTTPAPVAPEDPTTPVKPPPAIFPTSPLAQVVRLTQAGVDPSVIMTYITNSSSTFNLDSDKIIYASDAGVPSPMVTAMMQRDQFLQQQFAAAQAEQQAQQVQPAQPAPAPEPAPESMVDAAPQPEPQPVTVNYFYDSLAPYGSWVVINGYGRCWRPTVCVYNSSWQPYCDRGHWVYSDCGWYWNSEYAWGATFHYGRWFRDANIGWCWYPDTVWGPSWVTWRYSNNYCGWAPLPPRTSCQAGVGIVYNGGNVSVGFGFGLGASCYTFVPTRYFCSPHPRNYCVPPAQVTQVYNNTTIINNYNVNNHVIVNHGIAVGSIALATRTSIRPVPVHEINAGYARDSYYGQPIHAVGANHPGYYNYSSVPVRTVDPAQNRYSQPGQNWTAQQTMQPQRNIGVATIPQRPMPAFNSPAPAYNAPAPAENSAAEQSAPTESQPARSMETPRNTIHYYGARQNYYPPQHSAPQHASPANSPAASPNQQGGSHGGSPGGPGH